MVLFVVRIRKKLVKKKLTLLARTEKREKRETLREKTFDTGRGEIYHECSGWLQFDWLQLFAIAICT